jgi:hypothetical protein
MPKFIVKFHGYMDPMEFTGRDEALRVAKECAAFYVRFTVLEVGADVDEYGRELSTSQPFTALREIDPD